MMYKCYIYIYYIVKNDRKCRCPLNDPNSRKLWRLRSRLPIPVKRGWVPGTGLGKCPWKTGEIMGRSTINGGCNGKIMGTWWEKVGKYGTRTYTMEVSRWANHHTKWKIVRFTRAWDDVSFPEKMVCCFCWSIFEATSMGLTRWHLITSWHLRGGLTEGDP